MPAMTGPRLAIAQLRVHWTLEANLAALRQALAQAADAGARLVLFGELALTGYHREIAREADPERVQAGLRQLQADCARLRVAAAVGTPTWPSAGGRPCNSLVLIDEWGQQAATVHKDGLTFVETLFFQPGSGRPVATLAGLRCTAVLCREVEETALLHGQLQGLGVDLVLWPSLCRMGDEAGPLAGCAGPQAEPDYLGLARGLARHSGATWLQCNAPNAPNTPALRGQGGSVVVRPDGQLAFALPLDQPGLALFELGQDRFDWLPQPAELPEQALVS